MKYLPRGTFAGLYGMNWFLVHGLVVFWRAKLPLSYNAVTDGILAGLMWIHLNLEIPFLNWLLPKELLNYVSTVKPSTGDVGKVLYPVLIGVLTWIMLKFLAKSSGRQRRV
jgi:hypothetical protein